MRAQMIARNAENSRGVVIPMLAILMFSMVMMIGILVDIGRLEYIARQLQWAADTVALTAVNRLRTWRYDDPTATCHGNPAATCPDFEYTQVEEWRETKKAALVALKQAQILELNQTARDSLDHPADGELATYHGFRFNNDGTGAGGHETFHDCRNTVNTTDDDSYNNDTAKRGNLTVQMDRGVFCYAQASLGAPCVRTWVPLEGPNTIATTPGYDYRNHYCMANGVEVFLTLADVDFFFVKIFGIAKKDQMRGKSRTYLNMPNTCCQELCCGSFINMQCSGGVAPYGTPTGEWSPSPPTQCTPAEDAYWPVGAPTGTPTALDCS